MDDAALAVGKLDVARVRLFVPPNLKKFKFDLFHRIASHIKKLGGDAIYYDYAAIGNLPDELIPIVGCTPEFRSYIEDWRRRKRPWIYWDRGYLRRVFATWLPKGSEMGLPGGFYRWHLNTPQMDRIHDVPDDRWRFLGLQKFGYPKPWNKNGDYIVVADTLPDYWKMFSDPLWTKQIIHELKKYTKRKIILRDKESKLDLKTQLKDAHCLVAHGSIAAVEAVVLGCPVFVEPLSATALVGQTDFSKIEQPIYPERQAWLNSLAYCQFHEAELVDGTLWRLIR